MTSPSPSAGQRPRVLSSLAVLLLAGAAVTACTSPSQAPPGPPPAQATSAAGRTAAVYTPDHPLDQEQLKQAAEQLRKRAEARGLPDARVTSTAAALRLSVAGQVSGDRLAALGRRTALDFRPVLAVAAGAAAPEPGSADSTPTGAVPPELAAGFAALSCAGPDTALAAAIDPGAAVAVCGTVTKADPVAMRFALAPAAVRGTDIAKASAAFDSQFGAGWQVTVEFTAQGGKAFADLTGRIAPQPAPANQLAISVDGTVVSHPYVAQAIVGGAAVISGSFTEDEAKDLAAALSSGSLPAHFKAAVSTGTD
ncbi:hypothetical protein [Kitasatospora sp. NPDC058218]|uniref:SecDF P1 head subdomain-containing protein n=1 Tax=Kitasatospora sp. NPDC058218 TaxID=3346385 RepID=UPI0036DE391B